MTTQPGPLLKRFRKAIHVDQLLVDGSHLLVAVSGGLDSVVLLHLLRFSPGLPSLHIEAAHFDHSMRPESPSDATWVRGVCRAWRIPLHQEAAPVVPGSETEARDARYRFLLQVKEQTGSAFLLTGHHADDQAETVLHRAVRGTGLHGLAGIPKIRPPGLYRPLLPFSRADLGEYAAEGRVPYREDPTNRDMDILRNTLRHSVLPVLEKGPAPGARRALVRLSRLAQENEVAWETLMPGLLDAVQGRDGEGDFVVRSALLAYHPAVQTRILRTIFRGAGIELDEAGTRLAVEFTSSGASGRSQSLPGGVRWVREFDRFRLDRGTGTGKTSSLVLAGARGGKGSLCLGGSLFDLVWGQDEPGSSMARFQCSADALEFPLTFRRWEPGDRIELPIGTKKLKKLFGEARLPVRERERIPVLQDGLGRVLWIPGIALSTHAQIAQGSELFFIGIRNADER